AGPATPTSPSLSLHDALPISLPVTAWLEATTDRFTAPRSVLIGLDNRNYRLWLRGTRGDPRSALDAVLLQERVIPGIADKAVPVDRKSTRLNSSHVKIAYAGL